MRRMRVDHLTEYRFSQPVTLLPHRLLLRPRSSHDVRIVSSTLDIDPAPSIRWQRDALDNSVALVTFSRSAAQLRIASSVVIEHYAEAPLDFVVEEHAVSYPFAYAPEELLVLAPFRLPAWPADAAAVEHWLQALGLRAGRLETFVLLDRLNRAIRDGFRYEPREEQGVQSPAQTLVRRAGSCRDFAALFVDAGRHLGLATRFVSGYLHLPVAPSDDGATHAWAEVYLPGPGWKGFDSTGGGLTDADHIAVAVAHHPEKVPPVVGTFIGPTAPRPILHVRVHVQILSS